MHDQRGKNQLIVTWPRDLNKVLECGCVDRGGSIDRLIADHQQLPETDLSDQ